MRHHSVFKRLCRALVATSLFGAAFTIPTGGAGAFPPPSTAVLVAGSTNPPDADQPIVDLMTDLGFTVAIVDDDDTTLATTIDGYSPAVVVVSSSVVPSKIGAQLTTTTRSIVTWESFLFPELGLALAGSANRGEGNASNKINIVDSTHPITAPLSGLVKVTTTSTAQSWARPGGDVQVLATVRDSANRASILVAEPATTLSDGTTAAGLRVGLFMTYPTPLSLTADGLAIVGKAITYAADGNSTPPNLAPVVDAGADQTITLPTTTATLIATVTDDSVILPTPDITWSEPTGVTFTPVDAASTTATFPGSGTYTVTVTAFDGELTTSDTVDVTVEDPAATPGTGVLFVVGNAASPGSPDQVVIDKLVAAGIDITLIDDDNLPTDTSTTAGVIISSSVNVSKVGTTFTTVAVPVLTWEAYLLKRMNLATAAGETPSSRSVTIIDATHPLAAGLSGIVTVTTRKNRQTYGIPAPAASIVAHQAGQSKRAVLFAYHTDDLLTDGTPAPARRVVVFPNYSGMNRLSPDGNSIIDAAINFLLVPDNEPPVAPDVIVETDELTVIDSGPAAISFGATGTDPGAFDAPTAVAAEDAPFPNSDRFLVADTGNDRIQSCAPASTCEVGQDFFSGGTLFDAPRGVDVLTNGIYYIADAGGDRIGSCRGYYSCDSSGGFGSPGTAVGQFDSPSDVDADPTEQLLAIADTGNDRIQICTLAGSCTEFGSSGSAAGQFSNPEGVAFDPATGAVLIADTVNNRLQSCDASGTNCDIIGGVGTEPGQFDGPADVAFTADGAAVVVADPGNNRIQYCDALFTSCAVFDGASSTAGPLAAPHGVGFDPATGNILIADTGNDRIVTASPRTLLFGASDHEGGALTVVGYDASSVSGATVVVNADGSYSYDPTTSAAVIALDQGEILVDTFTYTISNAAGATTTATATVTVNGFGDCISTETHLRAAARRGGAYCVDSTTPIVLADGQIELATTLSLTSTGPANAVIDADGLDRVFYVIGALTLDDITITGGNPANSTAGGGIYLGGDFSVGNGSIVLNGATSISGNVASAGAGIFPQQTFGTAGSIAMNDTAEIAANTTYTGNTQGAGVGIYLNQGNVLTMNDSSTIRDNIAQGVSNIGVGLLINGAAIANMHGSASITGNIAGPGALSRGGGVYLANGNGTGGLTLYDNATITGNQTANDSGGIFRNRSDDIVNGVTAANVTGNTPNNCGGVAVSGCAG